MPVIGAAQERRSQSEAVARNLESRFHSYSSPVPVNIGACAA